MDFCLLSFAKDIGRDIGKNIRKDLSSKYSQKHLDHYKFAIDAFRTLVGNKIEDEIIRVSKISPQNNVERNEEKLLREKCKSPELRQKNY